jgi:hypothetical protein
MQIGTTHNPDSIEQMRTAQRARRDREATIKAAEEAVLKAVRALALDPDDATMQYAVREAVNAYDLLYRSQDVTDAVAKAIAERPTGTNLIPLMSAVHQEVKKMAGEDPHDTFLNVGPFHPRGTK